MTAPTPKRDTADRVSRTHYQARRTFGLGLAFFVTTPLMALLPHDTGAWLPLHWFLAGGVLTIISGATQMLAVTWSTSPAPNDQAAFIQRVMVAGGAVASAAGREYQQSWLLVLGALVVALALLLLAALLVIIRQNATTPRYRPAIDAYLAAIAFGVVGISIGAALGSGTVSSLNLHGAHLSINLFGLVGLVLLGTLPFFTATQARMKMAPIATAGKIYATVIVASGATVLISVFTALNRPGVAAVAMVIYASAIVANVALLPRIKQRQLSWAGARLVQYFLGVTWWVVAVLVLAYQSSTEADITPALRTLAIGGFAQIAMASLSYFGPVVRGGGHVALSAGFALARSWLSVAAANVAALGALFEVNEAIAAGLSIWAADVVVRLVIFVRQPTETREASAKAA